jgi:hypothetical protein
LTRVRFFSDNVEEDVVANTIRYASLHLCACKRKWHAHDVVGDDRRERESSQSFCKIKTSYATANSYNDSNIINIFPLYLLKCQPNAVSHRTSMIMAHRNLIACENKQR